MRRQKPQEPTTDAQGVATYNGRQFLNSQGWTTGSDRAELTYLRDLVAYYEAELRGANAFERSVNEALNTGDGSYRP
jgi:hypothetical protein